MSNHKKQNDIRETYFEGYAPVCGFRTEFDKQMQQKWCSDFNCELNGIPFKNNCNVTQKPTTKPVVKPSPRPTSSPMSRLESLIFGSR